MYQMLSKEFLLHEKNDKIKLASAELLSNLSLSKTVQKIVENGDFKPENMILTYRELKSRKSEIE